MPEALSSFLLSVSVILSVVLFIPCVESVVRLIRRDSRANVSRANREADKVFSRKVA